MPGVRLPCLQGYDDIAGVVLFSASDASILAASQNLTVWLSQGSEVR